LQGALASAEADINFSITKAKNASNQAGQVNKFMQTTWLPDLFQNTSTGGAGFTSYDLSQLGIKNDATFSVDFSNGDPLFSGLNDGTVGLGLGATEYWYQAVPIYQLSDNVAKTIRRHTLKAGLDWRWERLNVIQPPFPTGSFTFNAIGSDLPGVERQVADAGRLQLTQRARRFRQSALAQPVAGEFQHRAVRLAMSDRQSRIGHGDRRTVHVELASPPHFPGGAGAQSGTSTRPGTTARRGSTANPARRHPSSPPLRG